MQSMKQIIQATSHLNAARGLQNQVKTSISATQNSENSGKCTEQVNKLFLKFSTFYGHMWRGQFKNEYYSDFARKEWVQALQEFDEVIIEQAIDECLKNREMPPALAQFIDCCKQLLTRKTQFFQKEAYTPGDPKLANIHLQKMKEILNIKQR